MLESKMQNTATGSSLVSGAECNTPTHGPIDGRSLQTAPAWRKLARRSLVPLHGGVALMLLAGSALAQEPVPAPEDPPAEPAPAEPAPAEAAPAEAAPPEAAAPEAGIEGTATAEGEVSAQDAADLAALEGDATPVEAGQAEVVVTVDRRTKNL